jgi:hypothetical protein
MSTTAVLFLNLACAAIAGVLSAKVLDGRVKRDHAGALGVGLHLGTAYLVNTTFWPPIYVAVGSGIAAAVLVALAIRALHRPKA